MRVGKNILYIMFSFRHRNVFPVGKGNYCIRSRGEGMLGNVGDPERLILAFSLGPGFSIYLCSQVLRF